MWWYLLRRQLHLAVDNVVPFLTFLLPPICDVKSSEVVCDFVQHKYMYLSRTTS